MSTTVTEPTSLPPAPATTGLKHAVHVCQLDVNDDPAGWPLIAMCGHRLMALPAPRDVPLCNDCARLMATPGATCPVCGRVPW